MYHCTPATTLQIVLAEGRPSLEEAWVRQLHGVFDHLGATVHVARTSEQVLQHMRNSTIHLCVLDMAMSGKHGNARSLLRALSRQQLPVIAVLPPTPDSRPDERILARLMDGDASAAIRRPVQLDTLLHAFKRILERRYNGLWPQMANPF